MAELVAADYGSDLVVGRIVSDLPHNLALLLSAQKRGKTNEGHFYLVYRYGLHYPGERDAFGRDPFPPLDHAAAQRELDLLWKNPGIKRVAQRLVRQQRDVRPEGVGVLEAWELPLKLCFSLERPAELHPHLVRYLDSNPTRRQRYERALALLEARAPKQYRVFVACHLKGLPQNWVAKAWGVSRQSINELYLKSTAYIDTWVGEA